jgi:hypothetical protein
MLRREFLITYLKRSRLLVVGGLEKLIPAISLDPKLLLGRAYLPSSVRIEVGLFELFNEVFNLMRCTLDDSLLSLESGCDGWRRVNTDGPIEMIVAIF